MDKERNDLLSIYHAAIEAVSGDTVVKQYLEATDYKHKCHVIAIGKVAGYMMQGALDVLQDKLLSGLVISKAENLPVELCENPDIECVAGDHPFPTEKSLKAGQALVEYLQGLPEDAHCVFLISGGTSSLVEVLNDGVRLSDLQETTRFLLANDYDIHEINSVRKTISNIKGGGLWQYLKPQQTVKCLMISDVKGDVPAVIGSGLLFPDYHDGLPSVLPESVTRLFSEKNHAEPAENFSWKIIASLDDAKRAAQAKAEALGYSTTLVNDFIEGDAVSAGLSCVNALQHSETEMIVMGGETTVCLPAEHGKGGRSQHLALSAAMALSGRENQWLLSMSTDGVDGLSDDAGALVDGRTIQRGELYGVSAEECLKRANSNFFLEESGDLVYTGASRTNVMDIVIGLKH